MAPFAFLYVAFDLISMNTADNKDLQKSMLHIIQTATVMIDSMKEKTLKYSCQTMALTEHTEHQLDNDADQATAMSRGGRGSLLLTAKS